MSYAKEKRTRIVAGIVVGGTVTAMWFYRPDLIPWWVPPLAILLGAYMGFSTMVQGFMRSLLPFLNRRDGPATSGVSNEPATNDPLRNPLRPEESTMMQGRVEVGDVREPKRPKRRKSEQ